MADKEKTTKQQEKAVESDRSEVQSKVDAENEQGYRGTKVDPTPNENYTVEGVTAGKPTPETDPAAAAEAQASLRNLSKEPGEQSG